MVVLMEAYIGPNDFGWWWLTNLRLRVEFRAQVSILDSGMVIIKILRLFSYSGLSIKLRNPEIGLYLAQELYSR